MNYYSGVTEYENAYLQSKGKRAVPDKNGNIKLKVDKEIQGIQLIVIDKAGNILRTNNQNQILTIGLYNGENDIYIGLNVNKNNESIFEYSTVFVNRKGILKFETQVSTDGNNYTEAKTSVNKSKLQKKKSLEEYCEYNKTLIKTNSVYATAFDERFKKFIKDMKNNYMFMKGYEENYSKIFNYKKYKLIKKFTELLGNKVENFDANFKIISELVDSLVFDEKTAKESDPNFPGLYVYLFQNCLVKFYEEDDKKVKKYLKENPSKYDWDSMKIDEIYFKCRFEKPIKMLEKISTKKTVFEKKEILNEVNTLIIEEAKNVFESKEKKNFNLDGNDLLNFWIYIVAHCNLENMLAEAKFVSLFGSGGYNSDDYIAVNFASAVEGIKDEILKSVNTLSQYVESNKINL